MCIFFIITYILSMCESAWRIFLNLTVKQRVFEWNASRSMSVYWFGASVSSWSVFYSLPWDLHFSKYFHIIFVVLNLCKGTLFTLSIMSQHENVRDKWNFPAEDNTAYLVFQFHYQKSYVDNTCYRYTFKKEVDPLHGHNPMNLYYVLY